MNYQEIAIINERLKTINPSCIFINKGSTGVVFSFNGDKLTVDTIDQVYGMALQDAYNNGRRDFSNLKLNGLQLPGMEMDNANFSNSDMSNSNFEKSNFDRSMFLSVNLSNSNLKSSSLRAIVLSGANCQNTDFSYSDLTGADFSGKKAGDIIYPNNNIGTRPPSRN